MFQKSFKRKSENGKKWFEYPKFVLAYQKEGLVVVLVMVFSFVSTALISFSPTDQSFFYYDSLSKGWSNWCGALGAYVASLFFFFLGSAAYLVVPALWMGLFGWWTGMYERLLLRIVAMATIIGVVAALPIIQSAWWGKLLQSGFLGRLIGQSLQMLCGPIGSQLLCYNLVWLSGLIIARVSFMTMFKNIGYYLQIAARYGYWAAQQIVHYLWVGLVGGAHAVGRTIKSWFGFKSLDRIAVLPTPIVSQMIQPATQMAPQVVLDELEHFVRMSAHDDLFVPQKTEDSLHHNNSPLHDLSVEKASAQVKVEQAYRFADKKLFRHLHAQRVGRFALQRLANCVIVKDLVAMRNEQGRSLIDVMKEYAQPVAPAVQPFALPDVALFQDHRIRPTDSDKIEQERQERGQRLQEKLAHFGVKGEVVAINPGPVITVYEYKPDVDSKISKIIALEDDLAMALTALSIRIVAPIPGKNVVGFEIANQTRQDVYLADILKSSVAINFAGKLPVVLGVDTVGNTVIEDLSTMPHLLVAGSTGSGKSVGMHAMLASLLSKKSPDELKLVLVDPKRLEFAPYADIPHLLFPIVTNMRVVAPVLKWVVHEMEKRYEKMSQQGVRNIAEFHKNHGVIEMPYIVVMIDELADLMMVAGKEVEVQLARIAQMARAAGIHMIVATQRPSVDVVTGIIKVNFPSRMAFRVSSKIDSRTILDSSGGEKLLGRGDMLFMNSSSAYLKRVHGAYISEKEVEKLTTYLKAMRKVEYLDLEQAVRTASTSDADSEEPLYGQVCDMLKQMEEVSISMLQRHLRIGFNRSARLMERLESDGLIAPAQGSKPRKVIR